MDATNRIDFGELLSAVDDLGLFSATVTIERHDGTTDGVGRKSTDPSAWVEVSGLVDLEAMAASDVNIGRITESTERKTPTLALEKSTRIVMLNGYYPAILQEDRAQLTEGATTSTWDITGVQADSQRTYTRLAMQQASVA